MLGRRRVSVFAVLFAGALGAATAEARPVVIGTGPATPPCDMGVPTINHELGGGPSVGGPFSAMEDISWASTTTATSACQPFDVTATPNTLASITNNTGLFWDDLWFVADGELIFPPAGGTLPVLTNADLQIIETAPLGGGTLGLAFRIDNVGINTPPQTESLTADLIFEPSETWTFIVQDWAAQQGLTGGCGSFVGSISFGSLGVAGISCNAAASNASIIARLRAVPSP